MTHLSLFVGLPEHAVILDVKNRWNSFFLMVERFLEQFPAIDARLKGTMEKARYLNWLVLVSVLNIFC